MRNFRCIDEATIDADHGIFIMSTENRSSTLALRREGPYIAISASHGPIEIALRPRYEDLIRKLTRLVPVDGSHTTRQVGTGQAYLGIGLQNDGVLLVRPTIVADATGNLSFNFALTDEVRAELFDWLEIE